MKAQSYVFLLGWANNTQIFSKRRLIFYTYLVCNLLIINIYILKSAERFVPLQLNSKQLCRSRIILPYELYQLFFDGY